MKNFHSIIEIYHLDLWTVFLNRLFQLAFGDFCQKIYYEGDDMSCFASPQVPHR